MKSYEHERQNHNPLLIVWEGYFVSPVQDLLCRMRTQHLSHGRSSGCVRAKRTTGIRIPNRTEVWAGTGRPTSGSNGSAKGQRHCGGGAPNIAGIRWFKNQNHDFSTVDPETEGASKGKQPLCKLGRMS